MNFPPKIIFFGTPEFAVPVLKLLFQRKFQVVLVVTQPDKPVGRKQILTPSVVKEEARRLGLVICQDKKRLKAIIKELKPTVGIVSAYGEFIPSAILALFPQGCLNIHPSLLPKYRGPSPIQTAILNGDKVTGVSIIKLDEKMDHGEVISNSQLAISNSDTYQTLYQKLAEIGARLLIKTLPLYLAGKIKPKPQDDSKATYTKLLKKEDGKIDWQKTAGEIERQIRAYTPWPGSYSEFEAFVPRTSIRPELMAKAGRGIRNSTCLREAGASLRRRQESDIKLLKVKVCPKNFSVKPGNFCKENNQLYIQCGKDSLLIKKLQPAGKKAMSGQEFINGYLN